MTKFSEKELCQWATTVAEQHGATFVGLAPTYKYGIFRLADGRELEIHLYHIRDGHWPRNIDLYLTRQTARRSRTRAKKLVQLADLARDGQARLLDTDWFGPNHWYSFELQGGRVIQLRGSKLLTTGWPQDIEAYLAWSNARRQDSREHKNRRALFAEFKAEVERHNAIVLNSEWLGARVPHDVLLSDGTIRHIKPNQLKYSGWPVVPLDELRHIMAPYPVHILPDTADHPPQIFRVTVNGGLYLEGTFAELKKQWAAGVKTQMLAALGWAASAGLTLEPTEWRGMLAEYTFACEDGVPVTRKLPCAAVYDAQRQRKAELAKLRRLGSLHGAKLLSNTFMGREAVYQWEKDGEVISASAEHLLAADRERAKLAELKQRVVALALDVTLLSTEWAGMRAAYRWRLADGSEITAKLSQLRSMSRNPAVKLAEVGGTRPCAGTSVALGAYSSLRPSTPLRAVA